MSNVFFTADTHFGHTNIIKYCNRPFSCSEEMNTTMINNWNSVVGEHDVVWHLGDFSFGEPAGYIEQLNGHIILIRGNHDKNICGESERLFQNVFDYKEIKIGGKYHATLCHYAMRAWNKSHHNSWQLYGHSHAALEPVGKQWDVGVDNNNFTPLSEEEITTIMLKRPDNPGYINREMRRR